LRRAEDRLYSVPHKHFLPNPGKKRGETGLSPAGNKIIFGNYFLSFKTEGLLLLSRGSKK
jgi:hypothetical protein